MMAVLRIVRALGPVDSRSIGRDSLLRWVAPLPLLLALAARWLLPGAVGAIGGLLGVDVAPYYGAVIGFAILLLAPALVGMIAGFLLLDQRDDGTLTALLVTPLPPWAYLAYRLAAPMLLSAALTLAALPLSGAVTVGPLGLLLAALSAAPLAPIVALALAGFAANKVQGLALLKIYSLFFALPLLSLAVPLPWQLLLGLSPAYWPVRVLALGQAGDPSLWLYLAGGALAQGLLLAWLARRFAVLNHR